MIHYAARTSTSITVFISQMTGFPGRASECVGPFRFVPVDRHVELHTWVIYRQLAGGNGRFSVAFLQVMNKGCGEEDFPHLAPTPEGSEWSMQWIWWPYSLPSRKTLWNGTHSWLSWLGASKTRAGPGWWRGQRYRLQFANRLPHPNVPPNQPNSFLPAHGDPIVPYKEKTSGTWTSATRKSPGRNFLRNLSIRKNYHTFLTMTCETERMEFFNLYFAA